MKNVIQIDQTLYLKHKGYDKLKGKLSEGSSTLLEMLLYRSGNHPEKIFLGCINKDLGIDYITYRHLEYCAKKLANFLALYSNPKDIVALASLNRPEWIIAEYATYFSNLINCPLYTTFKEDSLSYIASITGFKIAICSTDFARILASKVISYLPADLIQLKLIILMNKDEEVIELCTSKGLEVITLEQILFDNGKNTSVPFDIYDPQLSICKKISLLFENNANLLADPVDSSRGTPSSEDIATLCFTSGTTGVPKGVELTHSNFIAQIESFEIGSKYYNVIDVNSSDVYMSYLPLSHVLERICFSVCMYTGAKAVFYRGDRTKIGEDIAIVKPTFLATVPKVLQTFYNKIESEVAKKKFYQRFLFNLAVKFKIFLQKFNIFRFKIIDTLIMSKVAKAFGGNIRGILCGGAAIDPYTIKYLKAVLNADIFQGYGQSEGLGANILCTTQTRDSDSVGIPFPSTQIKLVSVESADEGSPSQEKHLFMKGPAITKGYYQPKREVLERILATGKFHFKIENINEGVFDAEGWLNTGDICVYRNEKFYIVGRNKDLVKLTNGEYISPENIENRLKECDFIDDIFITKIKNEDSFAAIVSAPKGDVTEEMIATYLRDSLHELISAKILPRCVNVSRFSVVRESFHSMFAGLLYTPTFKKKRFLFNQKFHNEILKAIPINEFFCSGSKFTSEVVGKKTE